MCPKICKNSLGLTLGIAFAACHLGWMLLVWLGVAKPMGDWILKIHHFSVTWDVLPFNFVDAAILVGMTFVVGYVLGWLIAGLWNLVKKD